jgi:signal transduction histidine kinase
VTGPERSGGAGHQPAQPRLRFTQPTIRARLTLVYGGLLLVAGILLLGVTYTLVLQQRPGPMTLSNSTGAATAGSSAEQVELAAWQDALDALLIQGGIALAVVSVATIGFGWLLAGRLLQPLHRVTETARRIAEAPGADRGLHERIGLRGPPDEIKELADMFDVMLARLDHAFDGQRRFVANASHELRTPLTVNRALLETALYREAAPPELRRLGGALLETNARQERLLDALLLLARSEHEVTERAYLDLADIVEHVTAQIPEGAAAVTETLSEAPTSGNAALLERLVQNLVDNAVRHNLPAGGEVWVTTGTRPDHTAFVEVANTGAVVPPSEVPALFEPFRRLGTDRVAGPPSVAGLGLGLSIVRAVARAHGGQATAEPRDGGGLTVTVTLPAID